MVLRQAIDVPSDQSWARGVTLNLGSDGFEDLVGPLSLR